MIVRSRGLFVAVLLMLVAATPLAAQKVGFVDTRKILQEMPGRAQAEERMRVSIEALGARQKTMVDSLNLMMQSFEADSAGLPQMEKVARFTALQQYDARYRDTLEVLEQEAQEHQAAAMQPLFDLIRISLDDLRQAEGFAMIFDVAAQGNGIVSMDRNLDLSDRVLARIRAQASSARPPAAAPTTPAQPATPPPAGPVAGPTGARRP